MGQIWFFFLKWDIIIIMWDWTYHVWIGSISISQIIHQLSELWNSYNHNPSQKKLNVKIITGTKIPTNILFRYTGIYGFILVSNTNYGFSYRVSKIYKLYSWICCFPYHLNVLFFLLMLKTCIALISRHILGWILIYNLELSCAKLR